MYLSKHIYYYVPKDVKVLHNNTPDECAQYSSLNNLHRELYKAALLFSHTHTHTHQTLDYEFSVILFSLSVDF